jgi:hypothetical protein
MRWDDLPSLPRRLVDVSVQRSGLTEAQNPAPGFCDLPEVQQQVVRGGVSEGSAVRVEESLDTCGRVGPCI